MRKRRLTILSICLLAILLGCKSDVKQTEMVVPKVNEGFSDAAKDENGNPYLLGYITNEVSSGWTSFAMDYIKNLWESMGGEFVAFVSDYNLDKEVSMLNDLKQMEPDVILLHPSDSYAIAPAVQTAMDEGYSVFAVDMGVIGPEINSFVSVDQTELGRECGRFIVSQFSEENPGFILEIAGGLEQDGAQKRQAGFHEIIDAYDYVEIVQVVDTGWSSDKAFTGVQDAFERTPDINCIYTHSDFMLQGILEGLRIKGKLIAAGQEGHIVIASIDADPVGLQAIKDGFVDMEAENSPLMHMAVVANVMLAEIYGKSYEKLYSLSVSVITKENVNDRSLWGNIEKGKAPYVDQIVYPMPKK